MEVIGDNAWLARIRMKTRRRSGQPNWAIAIKKGVITDTGVRKGSHWRRLPVMNIEEMRKDKKKKLVGIPVVGEIVGFVYIT